MKDYMTSLNETEICTLIASMDNKTFFTGDSEGSIKQYDTRKKRLIKDYGKVHQRAVKILCSNSLFNILLSGDIKGDIAFINTRTEEIIKTYKKAHDFPITSMVVTSSLDCFISSDCSGNIKFWSFVKEINKNDEIAFSDIQLISTFPNHNGNGIYMLSLSLNGKYLFSTDYQGICKCWLVKDRSILWDFGKIHNSSFICLEPHLSRQNSKALLPNRKNT